MQDSTNPVPGQPNFPSPMHAVPQPVAPQEPMAHRPMQSQNSAAEKIEQILKLVYVFVAAILVFRFILSMLGANRQTIFVDFVYQMTAPFMFPFVNMFGSPVGFGQYRLEFEVFIALVVYALVFLGLARLVKILLK